MNDYGIGQLLLSVVVLCVLAVASMGGLCKLVEMYFERTEDTHNE